MPTDTDLLARLRQRDPDAPEARLTTRELQHTLTHTILNLTPGAVKVRLHRARLLLRETLAAEFATTSAAHHPAEGCPHELRTIHHLPLRLH